MQAAFAYKGAAGDSAKFIYGKVRESRAYRYIDPMCGSCTVPLELAAGPVWLALNDLNFYAYVNARSMFSDFGGHELPSTDQSFDGALSHASWGFWSIAYRAYIDACVAQARGDTTILAAVSRTLLIGSYRGTAWSPKNAQGGMIADWTVENAREHMLASLKTIERKKRPGTKHHVTCRDWILAVEDFNPGPNDFIYLEPPFPWQEDIRHDIYRWYDDINAVLCGGHPPRPPLFDSSAETISSKMREWAKRGATVMLMKQTHALPAHEEFVKTLGPPFAQLPIRGMPEHPAKEDYFLCLPG